MWVEFHGLSRALAVALDVEQYGSVHKVGGCPFGVYPYSKSPTIWSLGPLMFGNSHICDDATFISGLRKAGSVAMAASGQHEPIPEPTGF